MGGVKASKGALGGSAMAILGSLALNALKGHLAAGNTSASAADIDRYAMEAIDDPDTQRLIVRAMMLPQRRMVSLMNRRTRVFWARWVRMVLPRPNDNW